MHTHVAWDNLRIDVYGFTAFCEWFFKEYPRYFVVPVLIDILLSISSFCLQNKVEYDYVTIN